MDVIAWIMLTKPEHYKPDFDGDKTNNVKLVD